MSRHRPAVIFLDDLHWADVATVDVLSHLAPCLPRMRTLVVVAYRLHELALGRHPFGRLRGELIARGYLREVHVSLLAPDAVRDYVESAFGEADVPAELAAFVFRKTEGNPLFMADLVRYVRDTFAGYTLHYKVVCAKCACLAGLPAAVRLTARGRSRHREVTSGRETPRTSCARRVSPAAVRRSPGR